MYKIDVSRVLADDELAEAWDFYQERFTAIDGDTPQRHLMTYEEFVDICIGVEAMKIEKWRVFDDDGRLLGLATYTNDLHAWPLVSWRFFQRRWPVHFAEGRIWYCGFVAVADNAPPRTFAAFIEQMYEHANTTRGLIAIDYATVRDGLAGAVARRLTALARDRGHEPFEAVQRGSQHYWTYGVPPEVAA